MTLDKKLMELADAYAVAASMTLGEPSLKRLIDNTTTRAALLAEVTRTTDSIEALTTVSASARVQALEETALMAEGHYGDGHRLAGEIRKLIGEKI